MVEPLSVCEDVLGLCWHSNICCLLGFHITHKCCRNNRLDFHELTVFSVKACKSCYSSSPERQPTWGWWLDSFFTSKGAETTFSDFQLKEKKKPKKKKKLKQLSVRSPRTRPSLWEGTEGAWTGAPLLQDCCWTVAGLTGSSSVTCTSVWGPIQQESNQTSGWKLTTDGRMSAMAGRCTGADNNVKWQLCYDVTAQTWWMVSESFQSNSTGAEKRIGNYSGYCGAPVWFRHFDLCGRSSRSTSLLQPAEPTGALCRAACSRLVKANSGTSVKEKLPKY